MKLWKKGLLIFVAAVLLNTILMNAGIGGLVRELARLAILTGLVVLVVGLVRRK